MRGLVKIFLLKKKNNFWILVTFLRAGNDHTHTNPHSPAPFLNFLGELKEIVIFKISGRKRNYNTRVAKSIEIESSVPNSSLVVTSLI